MSISPWLLAVPLYAAWYCSDQLRRPTVFSQRSQHLLYAGLVSAVTALLLVGLGLVLPWLPATPWGPVPGGYLLGLGLPVAAAIHTGLRPLVRAQSWPWLQRRLLWLADGIVLLWVALHWV